MKILIADDHRLIREGLKAQLAELDGEVQILEAWDAATVWAAARGHPDLDLALLDLHMPGMNKAQSIAQLRESFPSLPVVVLSGDEDPLDVEEILRIGASGYIPKTTSGPVMINALRLVLAGGQYLPSLLLGERSALPAQTAPPALVREEPQEKDGAALLSPRQREVMDLLADGLSNKIIAQRLDLTVGTVKSHVAQIFQVLGVNNRTAAVIAARGLRPNRNRP